MSYELSRLDPYNREDVENVMDAAENFGKVIARNQPGFMLNCPWAKYLRASIAGEWMRFCFDPPYQADVEFWKITKEGRFIAYGLSRSMRDESDPTKKIYPIVNFVPLNWDSPDTFPALQFFVDNWLKKGFKTVYYRAPFREELKLSPQYKVWKVTDFPYGKMLEESGLLPYYTIYAIELV